jgi:hypothetical protein
VKELERAIMDYIHHWNESGRHFVWTKSSKQILRSVRKAAQDSPCVRIDVASGVRGEGLAGG